MPGTADCDGCATNGCEVDLTTDPMNCGRCGRACAWDGICNAGMCNPQELFDGSYGMYAYGFAVDSQFVYIGHDLYVDGVPKTGGPGFRVCECAANGSNRAGGLAVAGNTVYFSGIFDGWIYTCSSSKNGWSGPSMLGFDVPYLNDVALDANNVFVAAHIANAQGNVARVPLDGGAATPLDNLGGAHHGAAIDDTFVYFGAGTELYRVAKNANATTPTMIAPVQSALNVFAIDDTDIYFADAAGVNKVPKAGGSPTVLKGTANWSDVWGIAVDSDRVSFRRASQGDIWAWNKDGSGMLRLAKNQPYTSVSTGAHAFAADESLVYWIGTTGSSYLLYRTPK
jgi:hypothetical protein